MHGYVKARDQWRVSSSNLWVFETWSLDETDLINIARLADQ